MDLLSNIDWSKKKRNPGPTPLIFPHVFPHHFPTDFLSSKSQVVARLRQTFPGATIALDHRARGGCDLECPWRKGRPWWWEIHGKTRKLWENDGKTRGNPVKIRWNYQVHRLDEVKLSLQLQAPSETIFNGVVFGLQRPSQSVLI